MLAPVLALLGATFVSWLWTDATRASTPVLRCGACLLVLVASLVPGGAAADRVFITDALGRALVLHGANVDGDAKGDPLRMPSVDRAGVERMARDWGFNLARFLILWDAVEPEPGRYGEDYFDRVEERLDWFAEAGILVVLDMHQDVYSRVFCCDGAPRWAVRDDGLPFVPQAIWWMNYFQPAVQRAFDNFFDWDGPHADLQQHYLAAWARVAERFRDHPAVLGYDIMNEPFPGTAGPRFERDVLTPFTQRAIESIRRADPDGWIFYEPMWAAPAAGLPSQLGLLHDPRPGEPRLAYFPHLYSLTVEATGAYVNDTTVPLWAAARTEEAAAQGAPVLIGEFGHVDGVINGEQFLADVVAMADEVTSGWAYWEYNDDSFGFVRPDGSEKPEKLGVLVRTYAQRVAGRPLEFGYDPETRTFTLLFEEVDGVAGATQIYVPEGRSYPDGWTLTVSRAEGSAARRWHSDQLPRARPGCDGGVAVRGRVAPWEPCSPPPAARGPRVLWDAEREILSLRTPPGRSPHLVTIEPRRR